MVKHANATRTEVTLVCEDNRLKLTVFDNGTGFDTQKVSESSGETCYGFGLSMMKERVTLLGGTIQINSVIGEGTTVSVEIPLQEKEEKCGND